MWKLLFFVFFLSLVIRGDREERAVLCSGDKTYDLKIADTSNLLLFVPGCKTPDQLTDNQSGAHVVHTKVSDCQPDILQNTHSTNPQCVYVWRIWVTLTMVCVDLGILQQLLGTEENTT